MATTLMPIIKHSPPFHPYISLYCPIPKELKIAAEKSIKILLQKEKPDIQEQPSPAPCQVHRSTPDCRSIKPTFSHQKG
jgi:hypothetical protein